MTALGSTARKKGMVCGDERGHEILDLPSLSAPVVVLCSEIKDNINLRAEVNTDTAVMQFFAISGGLRLGAPPAESLAKAIRQEIEVAVLGAIVEIRRGSME